LWRPETYDAVFFRNVFMYFTPDAGKAVMDRVTGAVAPGGVLFLGHAETLRGMSHGLDPRHTHDTFYYQRGEPPSPSDGWVSAASSPFLAAPLPPTAGTGWVSAIEASAGRIQALTAAPRPSGDRAAAALANGWPQTWDLAIELLRQERFGAAIEVVEAFLPSARSQPDVLLLHASLLIHAGQFDRAEEVCQRLIDVDAVNAGAHYLLASCRESHGDWPAAVAHHQAAGYLDPGFAMPRLRLGLLARGRGDLEVARRELGSAVALLSTDDAARIVLFGGGFARTTLIELCRAELVACGGTP
jgi:chemotaxis protein methyltransferase CheR